jgi:hypothetical protein
MMAAADDAAGAQLPTTDGAPQPTPAGDPVEPGPGDFDTSAADLQLIAAAIERATATPATVETGFVPEPTGEPLADLPEPVCGPATTTAELTTFFDGGEPMTGADYQRAYPLPDGRVLWLFQDAFLPTPHGPELVHNVGLLQSEQCFQLLRNGSEDAPTPYLFPEPTDRYDRWFWPLGGDIGTDGALHVFVSEMIEHGGRYLQHTEPVATWLVTISVADLSVVDHRLARDSSPELYGWSVVSAGEHTYLYSHCYRQFGYEPKFSALAHDLSCTAEVTVARIPRGRFEARPEYWDGSTWSADPRAAVPVIPIGERDINPTQVALFEGRFVAVTKVGDWWGRTIVLDMADAPEGPWETVETIPVAPECDGCNTYFASIVPFGAEAESIIVALSGNTWGGDDLDHYTPTFLRVPLPARSLGPQLDAERIEAVNDSLS